MKKYWNQWKERLEEKLNGLSYNQKLILVLGALLVFMSVDLWHVWSGFSDHSLEPLPEIRHIQIPPIIRAEQTDTLHFKNPGHGTEEE